MAKFLVKDTFELSERQFFVLAGSVVEGEISKGMLIRIPLNTKLEVTERIDAVEWLTGRDGVSTALCMKADHEVVEFWRGLNIKGDLLEVSIEPSEIPDVDNSASPNRSGLE